VDALVNARILVADVESRDNPTVEVAHETVFNAWDRLDGWIKDHADELRGCTNSSARRMNGRRRGRRRSAICPIGPPSSNTERSLPAACRPRTPRTSAAS
jgi:hypothetical protein